MYTNKAEALTTECPPILPCIRPCIITHIWIAAATHTSRNALLNSAVIGIETIVFFVTRFGLYRKIQNNVQGDCIITIVTAPRTLNQRTPTQGILNQWYPRGRTRYPGPLVSRSPVRTKAVAARATSQDTKLMSDLF